MNTHLKVVILALAAAYTLALSACGGDPSAEVQETTPTVTAPVATTTLLGGTIQGKALTLSATVTTLAGSSSNGFADGTGLAARFNSPIGITTDGTNLYIADTSNNRIRKMVIATGEVTTLAGSARGFSDGTGSAASFSSPYGITTDGANLYVADTINNRIRKLVIATGEVTTVAGAGSGFADGTGSAAQFSSPVSITTDGTNLYVVDPNNHRIRKIVIATGEVSTLAGSAQGFANGTGSAASFNNPYSVTTDGANLYVADTNNNRIRKIVIATGEVTTLAGSTQGFSDGTGSAAQFNTPVAITTDGTNLYVSDVQNHRIRKIVIATGEVTTLAGSTQGFSDGIGSAAQFDYPYGLTTDGNSLYVADVASHRIRRIQ